MPLLSRAIREMPTLGTRQRALPERRSKAVSTPLSKKYKLPLSSRQGADALSVGYSSAILSEIGKVNLASHSFAFFLLKTVRDFPATKTSTVFCGNTAGGPLTSPVQSGASAGANRRRVA